jgi:hypothetical protein
MSPYRHYAIPQKHENEGEFMDIDPSILWVITILVASAAGGGLLLWFNKPKKKR